MPGLDIEGFRKAGYAAVDSICAYYERLQAESSSLSSAPASASSSAPGPLPVCAQVQPGFLSALIPASAPEEGEPWEVIERDYHEKIMPGITHWQSPSFFAYYPCNATFEGGIADLHAAMISNPGFNWSCSPSVTELEVITLDWVARMLCLSRDFTSTSPSGKGGGIILGSASEVAITVAIAARERALALLAERCPPPERGASTPTDSLALAKWRADLTSRLVMYGTTQTHSVGAKAALILGLDFRALDVSHADGLALRGATLQAALEEDEAAGRVPFLLVASMGTTSSGAVDDLSSLLPVAQSRPSLWVHVDAAYAGVALSLPEVRRAAHPAALDQCHSFSTNFHKWGLVQFDCSPLLVRDRTALTSALTLTPEFLRTRQGDAGSVLDMRNMQMPLGRRFRSLKLWFVLRSYGLAGFREHLRRHMALADLFQRELLAAAGPHADWEFELVAPPAYALRVFRIRLRRVGGEGEGEGEGEGGANAETGTTVKGSGQGKANPDCDSDCNPSPKSEPLLSALNRSFHSLLESAHSHELLLTQTTLPPPVGFCLRFVVGSPWTREEHVRRAVGVLRGVAEEVVRDWRAGGVSGATATATATTA